MYPMHYEINISLGYEDRLLETICHELLHLYHLPHKIEPWQHNRIRNVALAASLEVCPLAQERVRHALWRMN